MNLVSIGLVAALVVTGAIAVGATAGHAAVVARPSAAPATRPCGSAPGMAPNQVRASLNVSCTEARWLMKRLLGGSSACYPHGFTSTPHCKVNGFACSAHSPSAGTLDGRCVNENKLVLGKAYA
jgi:hypothetical protein